MNKSFKKDIKYSKLQKLIKNNEDYYTILEAVKP